MLLPIELQVHHRATVAQVILWWKGRGDALPVAGLPCFGPALHGTGRRVLDACRRKRLGRDLIEASEGLILAVDVEGLDSSDEAIGAEDPEHEERALIESPARAVGSAMGSL